jgi:hypothetical protein
MLAYCHFQLLGHLLNVAQKLDKDLGLDNGLCLVINDGPDGNLFITSTSMFWLGVNLAGLLVNMLRGLFGHFDAFIVSWFWVTLGK